jgi:ribonucleoside-triphosphate reductase
MDVMIDGDYWGKPFNFPKPEISIEPDFVTLSDEIAAWDMEHPDIPTYKELYLMAFDLAAKFGTPYFDNQIPAYRGAGKGISCYQCLPEDTIVHIMRDNKPRDVPIKDLLTSDLILTPTRGYQPFEGILSKPYEGEMIEFVMRNRQSYSCTPDHSVVVKTIDMPHFVTMPANEVSLDDEMVVLVNGVATSVQIECIHTIPNFRGVVYDLY